MTLTLTPQRTHWWQILQWHWLYHPRGNTGDIYCNDTDLTTPEDTLVTDTAATLTLPPQRTHWWQILQWHWPYNPRGHTGDIYCSDTNLTTPEGTLVTDTAVTLTLPPQRAHWWQIQQWHWPYHPRGHTGDRYCSDTDLTTPEGTLVTDTAATCPAVDTQFLLVLTTPGSTYTLVTRGQAISQCNTWGRTKSVCQIEICHFKKIQRWLRKMSNTKTNILN